MRYSLIDVVVSARDAQTPEILLLLLALDNDYISGHICFAMGAS